MSSPTESQEAGWKDDFAHRTKTCENFWLLESNNHLLDALKKFATPGKHLCWKILWPLKKNNLNLNKLLWGFWNQCLFSIGTHSLWFWKGPCNSAAWHLWFSISKFHLPYLFCLFLFPRISSCSSIVVLIFLLIALPRAGRYCSNSNRYSFQGLSGGLILVLDVCSLNFKNIYILLKYSWFKILC